MIPSVVPREVLDITDRQVLRFVYDVAADCAQGSRQLFYEDPTKGVVETMPCVVL